MNRDKISRGMLQEERPHKQGLCSKIGSQPGLLYECWRNRMSLPSGTCLKRPHWSVSTLRLQNLLMICSYIHRQGAFSSFRSNTASTLRINPVPASLPASINSSASFLPLQDVWVTRRHPDDNWIPAKIDWY